jgi:hypothetical protein
MYIYIYIYIYYPIPDRSLGICTLSVMQPGEDAHATTKNTNIFGEARCEKVESLQIFLIKPYEGDGDYVV